MNNYEQIFDTDFPNNIPHKYEVGDVVELITREESSIGTIVGKRKIIFKKEHPLNSFRQLIWWYEVMVFIKRMGKTQLTFAEYNIIKKLEKGEYPE